MSALVDITGERYGRLVVIRKAGVCHLSGGVRWVCKCDCGNEIITASNSLRRGNTKSCGCLQKERVIESNTTHGESKTKLYFIWCTMKRRCYKKGYKGYKWYGALGITMCNGWLSSFQVFHDWAMLNGYKEGLTIDRKNNYRMYCPSNCQWMTQADNASKNRNKIRSTSTSGHCGVYISKPGKWVARITTDSGVVHLGTYDTKKEAIAARKAAEKKYL